VGFSLHKYECVFDECAFGKVSAFRQTFKTTLRIKDSENLVYETGHVFSLYWELNKIKVNNLLLYVYSEEIKIDFYQHIIKSS
jgi:hypothetical protein